MDQARKVKTEKKSSEVDTAEAAPQGDSSAQGTAEETDALLDEIDSVLEENAQEFVAQYVQKGGQ